MSFTVLSAFCIVAADDDLMLHICSACVSKSSTKRKSPSEDACNNQPYLTVMGGEQKVMRMEREMVHGRFASRRSKLQTMTVELQFEKSLRN